MQAVGFVEHAVRDGGSPFADMDKGGLAQSGEEFVRRLGRKDRGTVLGMILGIASHGKTIFVHLVKSRVSPPRLCKEGYVRAHGLKVGNALEHRYSFL